MRLATITKDLQIAFTTEELEAVGVTAGDEFIVSVEKGVIVLTPTPEI